MNRKGLRAAAEGKGFRLFAPGCALLALGLITARQVHGQTAVPSEVPAPVTILQNIGPTAQGYIFLGPQDVAGLSQATLPEGPEIIDSQGRIVWFMPLPAGESATDFRVQTYQGNPVLTWAQPSVNPADLPTDYILDNTYKIIATVRGGNGYNIDEHEFQLTPQNTALIAINDVVTTDLSSVGGPTSGNVTEGSVQEIDVATGAVLFQWHSLDYVPLTESHVAYSPSSTAAYDYFHINSVKLDTDGNLLISSRHTWTVYKVNRTTGAIIWRLGGKNSSFTLGSGLPFAWQHDVEAVDSSTLRIFDNESNGVPVLPNSRVIWVNHDDTAMTANVVQTIVHPDMLSVLAEGSAQSLGNGDTFVEWGILGRFSEFNSTGQLIYDGEQAPGYGSYRGFRFPWIGAPTTSPTAVALQNSDGTIAVHAIWNGATQVATWQVIVGGAGGSLAIRLAGTAPWNGVDTVITITGPADSVQVVALDSTGATLGTSAAISGPFADVFPVQPASQAIATGGTVVFNAVATGSAPAYQWLLNGNPVSNSSTVSGATTPTLVITNATAAASGTYACVATIFGNAATSSPATLTVMPTNDAGQLINMSGRAWVGTGGNVLIAGFVIGGTTSRTVLIRASGPALSQLGVSGVLADPALQLYQSNGSAGSNLIQSNTGWGGNAQIAAAAASVGAFSWGSAATSDSALLVTLPPGAYTAEISGAGGDSGISLVEVYELP